MILQNLDEGGFSSIRVINCGHLHVASRALTGLPALQQVNVANISRLTLEEEAFSWSNIYEHHQHTGLLVNISNCHVPELPSYCFRGHLREVLLSSVNISQVRAYAFSSIDHADKLELNNVQVGDFDQQAFKKFSVDVFSIKDCVFDTLPTRTMVDVEVHKELKLENVSIDTIKHSALKIHGSKQFQFLKSTINHVEHEAFHVHTRGSVLIQDNMFFHLEKSAFVGITLEKRYLQEFQKQDLVFENNTLMDFESAPLIFNTTGFNPRLDLIVICQVCSCQNAEYWTSELVYFSSDPQLVTPAPHVSTVLYCQNPLSLTNIRDFQRRFCHVQDSSVLLTLAFISGAVVSVSILLMFIYCGFKERAKRYINVPNSPSPLKLNKNQMLVIPDGKTYRETELHVIVEHAEPIIASDYVRASHNSEVKA